MAGLRILLLVYMMHFADALDLLGVLKKTVYSLAEQLAQLINTLGAMTSMDCYCDKYLCPQVTGVGHTEWRFHRLPLVTACCDVHDLCYGTCGAHRNVCDRQFKSCLDSICGNITEHPQLFPESDPEGCWAKARLFDSLVRKFGCSAFLSEQARHCYCA